MLHQLKRLGKVWQDVLPVTVYCKAMGTLLNTALTEIIARIAALEVTARDGCAGYSCREQQLQPLQVLSKISFQGNRYLSQKL